MAINLLPILQRAATEAQGIIATFTNGSFTLEGDDTVYTCVPASVAQRIALQVSNYDDTENLVIAVTKTQFTAPAPWLTEARAQLTHNGQAWSVVSYNADAIHYVLSLKPHG